MNKNYWFGAGEEARAPYIAVFRNRFVVDETALFRLKFSADERCQLFLNGERVIDGPERGDKNYWYYQNYETVLVPGKYCLVTRVLCFGEEMTAHAQQSVQHGFYAESLLLDDNWEYQLLENCEFKTPFPDWGTYPRCEVGADYNWDILEGSGGKWKPAVKYSDGRMLHAPDLPLMRYEPETNYREIRDSDKLLVAFDDYVCVWPEFVFSGKGTVRVRWAETLYDNDNYDPFQLKGIKGNRDEFTGKHFIGKGNLFKLPGGRRFHWVDYWWKAGRYLEISLEGDCRVEQMKFFNTGYPYHCKLDLSNQAPRVKRLMKISYRTLQACSHETYMDCPYYEQLMYIGDARIEALCTYMITKDRRLVKKSLRLLARSQRADGMILSRWPSKIEQEIPSFALIYILMLHDFSIWDDDAQLIKELLPTARRAAAYFCAHLNSGYLLENLPGWNFIDWVQDWRNGVPPGVEGGGCCSLNWFFVLALQCLADMERRFGDGENAQRYSAAAERTRESIRQTYYNPGRGLFSEDIEQRCYSEHAQVLALLAAGCTEVIPGLSSGALEECSLYFSFYYQEACLRYGLNELFERRLEKHYALLNEGLKTIPEEFENPRSDCHAWGAYPLYYLKKIRNDNKLLEMVSP